ncbi:K(+)-transporting ATPase subunit C [Paraburkholderia nodosa]|uniref:K(+)-transporting ATPase subunit C n=1 Tax=Paraburkholderia nodosa TaxID=392320 RepID=UPI000488A56F|nr:K(+)-transporting ATPase subunit C [Paraburkholderia nodosa]
MNSNVQSARAVAEPAQGAASPAPSLRALMRPALVSAVFFMLLTGLAYPLLTTGIAQVLMPSQANGSLIDKQHGAVGSAQIGQDFTQARYFHPRPSATLGADPKNPAQTVAQPYNSESSGASNLAPTSKALIEQVASRAAAYRRENALAGTTPVPVDAVTASASGLDPDISVANALLQAQRVARARGLPVEPMRALVAQHTKAPQLGVLGDPRVNVLELNLALDALSSSTAQAIQ